MTSSRRSGGFREIVISEETKEERQAAIRKIDSAMGDSVQNRNRRMFGNLLGHLNQARSLINKDQGLFDKQRKLEQEAIERERKESELIRETQKQVILEEKEKEQQRLNELQREERIILLKKSLQNRTSGFHALGKFARTETSPSLYWLPAHGNEKTMEYVEKSRVEMEEKAEEERKRVEARIDELKAQAVEINKQFEVQREKEEKQEKQEEKKKVDAHLLDIGADSEGEMEDLADEKKEVKDETKAME